MLPADALTSCTASSDDLVTGILVETAVSRVPTEAIFLFNIRLFFFSRKLDYGRAEYLSVLRVGKGVLLNRSAPLVGG